MPGAARPKDFAGDGVAATFQTARSAIATTAEPDDSRRGLLAAAYTVAQELAYVHRWADAVAAMRPYLENVDSEHPYVVFVRATVADRHGEAGHVDATVELLRQLGPEHRDTLNARGVLAELMAVGEMCHVQSRYRRRYRLPNSVSASRSQFPRLLMSANTSSRVLPQPTSE